jgi:hypothetical protein
MYDSVCLFGASISRSIRPRIHDGFVPIECVRGSSIDRSRSIGIDRITGLKSRPPPRLHISSAVTDDARVTHQI